jgi:hypothetical protein
LLAVRAEGLGLRQSDGAYGAYVEAWLTPCPSFSLFLSGSVPFAYLRDDEAVAKMRRQICCELDLGRLPESDVCLLWFYRGGNVSFCGFIAVATVDARLCFRSDCAATQGWGTPNL